MNKIKKMKKKMKKFEKNNILCRQIQKNIV